MQVVPFPERKRRARYRHDLRTLTYITLDEGNGGIVRNFNHEGMALQAVAPLREQQRVRLRFELRYPRLRVEAHGQVCWATSSGQCGIRFIELPARTRYQIDEWIFSNLLDAVARDAMHPSSIFEPFAGSVTQIQESDGLTLSAAPNQPIMFDSISPDCAAGESVYDHLKSEEEEYLAGSSGESGMEPDWISRSLSGGTLAWMVDGLLMFAGLLTFALVFLSFTHELPRWPWTICAGIAVAAFVVASYRILFSVFGRASLGVLLAQAASGGEKKEEEDERLDRFR